MINEHFQNFARRSSGATTTKLLEECLMMASALPAAAAVTTVLRDAPMERLGGGTSYGKASSTHLLSEAVRSKH